MIIEDTQKRVKQMKVLISELNRASDFYYNSEPIMSDYEWDKMFDELKRIEGETGIIFPNSPTQNVGYKVLDEIKKVTHNHPMLSLEKCHFTQELYSFSGEKTCILSVKCDGLTTSLRYLDGKLVSAESRGDGYIGGDVLNNVKTIKNVPLTIPYKKELIVDGEVIIGWDTFHEINNNLPEGQERYKHPRNLASGTLNNLDNKVAASRNMRFIAWRVIKGLDEHSMTLSFMALKQLGFEVVPYWTYNNSSSDKEDLSKMLESLRETADKRNIPYDGAVMSYDNIDYANSLGNTSHHFNHSIAYKYEDKIHNTTLRAIEWNTSRTGLINPVAVFDPIDLDGAITTRATLHNLSYIEDLELGIGDTIQVYRANAVIPKVYKNLTRSDTWEVPMKCPCCHGNVKIKNDNGSKTLYCTNPDCKSKLLGKLVHFVSRNAINIDGLSEQTLEKLVDLGWVISFKDLYNLKFYKDKMMNLEGFGQQSVNKLLDSIEKSKNTTLDRFINALSIPLIGKSTSKDISNVCHGNFHEFVLHIKKESMPFSSISGFGTEMSKSISRWWSENYDSVIKLSNVFSFKEDIEDSNKGNILSGKSFVITGSLVKFKNRDELVNTIESNGGKVVGSVSAKTNYLINNDIDSISSKNEKAKRLGIPIITEDDFTKMLI